MEQNRLRSKIVWLAVLAQLILIIGFVVPIEISDTVKIIATAVIEILTIFGVLNNPTSKTNF